MLIYAFMDKFSNLKISGNKEWLEAGIAPCYGCIIDYGMPSDNLDLMVVPKYGRNSNESG